MMKLMKLAFVALIAFLLTACQFFSVFVIENDSPNPIVVTYSNWPRGCKIEPRIGNLKDAKKAGYNLKSLPIADFQYGKNESEIIVTVPSKSAICLDMSDACVMHAGECFASTTLFIKTVRGSIKYEGADIITLFKPDSRWNFHYIYTYNNEI